MQILDNIKTIALLAALICAGVFCYLYNIEVENREMAEVAGELPADVISQYVLKNRELLKALRDAEGKTVVKKIYVPDEGKIVTITKQRDEAIAQYQKLLEELKTAKSPEEAREVKDKLNSIVKDINKTSTSVDVQNKGFTARFGGGMIWSPADTSIYNRINLPVVPSIDFKFAYWDRYSLLLQANPYFVGPALTRHIDDVTPRVLHLLNLEVGVTGGISYSGGKRIGLILRSNF